MHPVLGVAAVLGVLVGLLGALRLWQQAGSPHPETVRKVLHVGMGLVAVSLPWLFRSALPVLVLCSLATAAMLAIRLAPGLRQRFGGVVCGVERASWGDIYFPIAVGVTFAAARGDKVLFAVPMLALTLADATAALIGLRYGLHRYRATEGRKSAEGSLAFFTVAFASTCVPLLLAGVEPSRALLTAAILGLLVMALEAVAWRGLDNLFVPLGALVLLKVFLGLPTAQLALRLVMAVALFALMIALRRQTTLNESALLGAAFAAYVFGAVGGWRWLVAPLTLLLSYTTLLSPRTRHNIARVHTVHSVLSVGGAGFGWLFLATVNEWRELLYPYTLAFGCHLVIIGCARLRRDYPRLPTPLLLGTCVLKSWVLLLVPLMLLEGQWTWRPALLAAGPLALAGILFYWIQPGMEDCPIDTSRWIRQALVAGGASVLGLFFL